jgi:hypothetical protein
MDFIIFILCLCTLVILCVSVIQLQYNIKELEILLRFIKNILINSKSMKN